MKLLITGASGQLGREWVTFCEQRAISFEAFDSKSLDITNKELVSDICERMKPDVLINCAAYTKVDMAEDEPELSEQINAEALAHISSICSEFGIKLVHYSTDYVFAGTKIDQEMMPNGYPEDYETDPINVYGATKRNGEQAVIVSGCEFLILRVSWLCGRFGNNFVKTMIRLGTEKDELNVVSDQFGSPTFADQVVEQSFELLNQAKMGIYHLSSEGITTWYDFAKEIFRLKEIDVSINPVNSEMFKTKAKRPAFSKLSTKKISSVPNIGIIDWQKGLQKLIITI